MKVAERPEVPLEAAQALARHLREKPEAAMQSAEQLAREFGLKSTFVAEFLESLKEPRETSTNLRPVLWPFQKGFHLLRLLFRKLTANPLSFIGITTVASIAGYLILEAFVLGTPTAGSNIARRGDFSLSLAGNDAIFLAFTFATLLLHLACYFRHGMVRYPLFGGLICWMISAPTLMVLVWRQLPNRLDEGVPLALIGIAMGMLFLNIVYACTGIIAAVAGGAWRIRLKDKERDRLTRQELLERMFDIQERLQSTEGSQSFQRERIWEKWSDRFDRNPYAIAIGLGLGHSLLLVLLFGGLLERFVGPGSQPPLISLLKLAVGAMWVMLLAAVGFFSSQTLKAILNSWLFVLSGLPPLLIPLGRFGVSEFHAAFQPFRMSFQLGFALVVAAISAAGGRVEQRAARERRLVENDPAALLAELVKLQWQLSPQTADVCIIVVDAAGSAEMKSLADPWTVEYSFREYQGFLEDIVHAHGGSIINTAGDGAVAEFPSVQEAYEASRHIQTEVETFNRKVNKLEKSFRLRIGMHMGPVAGCINDVEFSAVIDIAAHVQGTAPVGGIALTKSVADHLEGEALAQLAEPVDEQIIYISMRPTMDV